MKDTRGVALAELALVLPLFMLLLLGIRWRSDGWQQRVAPYNLFVLKKGPESRLASGLLRQPGARVEYRGQGAIVIFRPSRQR